MLKDFIIVFLGAIIFSTILFFLFPQSSPSGKKTAVSPVVKSIEEVSRLISNPLKNRGGEGLEKAVAEALAGTKGTYGIYIKNLKTGQTFAQNEKREFASASLYKLWVLGAVFNEVDSGKLSLNKSLSRKVEDLNRIFDIASDEAELTSGTVTRTVESAIEQMITISDNYSALILSATIGNSKIAEFMKEQGLTNSTLGQPPTTTPADIALYYERLYEGKVIDKKTSAQMLTILSRQEINDRIPKYLPQATVVAHKTGELYGFKHDAGIVYAKDPILMVLMSETDDPAVAADREAKIARAVYNYFEK